MFCSRNEIKLDYDSIISIYSLAEFYKDIFLMNQYSVKIYPNNGNRCECI